MEQLVSAWSDRAVKRFFSRAARPVLGVGEGRFSRVEPLARYTEIEPRKLVRGVLLLCVQLSFISFDLNPRRLARKQRETPAELNWIDVRITINRMDQLYYSHAANDSDDLVDYFLCVS